MQTKRGLRLTLKQREGVLGYLFISPFIIGFILFILAPVVQSIVFSTNKIEITSTGFDLIYIGAENYKYVLLENADFLPTLLSTTGKMLNNVFWIIVFSFFAAVLLNQRFKGRLLARTIFFLPVIVSAGVVLKLDQTDYLIGVAYDTVSSASNIPGSSFLSGQVLIAFLLQLQIPRKFLELIAAAVDMIPEIINAAGVQILVFLAGLQSIDPSLYEASEVEGATSWENFWMITFPLLTPLIITNIVYTIVDFFISPSNEVITMIRETTFFGRGFGTSSAMMWIYFASIAVVLAIVMGLWSRIPLYRE